MYQSSEVSFASIPSQIVFIFLYFIFCKTFIKIIWISFQQETLKSKNNKILKDVV